MIGEAPSRASLAVATHATELADGTRLVYREWTPATHPSRTVVLFHRGHEHSGRLADVVEGLGLKAARLFAWDARGHGESGGERGDAPGFSGLVRDVDEFVRHLVATHGVDLDSTIVIGHSVGAVAAAAWVHDYAPRIRALVLATPALRIKLYVPLARLGLRLLRAVVGRPRFITSYVTGRMLTHDPAKAESYDRDPLVSRRISVGLLLGLHDTATRLLDDAAAITTPTLVLAGESDWVVELAAERRFFERLGSSLKRMRVFPGMYHDILHERGCDEVFGEIRRFVDEVEERADDPLPLLDADRNGHTYDELVRLSTPLPRWSARSVGFRASRGFLRSVGRLADGIRLGWSNGFDSGASLDYVYENRARGITPIGRLVDRIYLNSPGWTGVRQRRSLLEALLREAIDRAGEDGAARVRVLDVASGCGRYVLEVARSSDMPVDVVLRDVSPDNVRASRELAAELGLCGATTELGDAFDPTSLASVAPRPDVVVVSGLYELFSDNAIVLRSLRAIAGLLRPGGLVVYTGQPWHPQLELIARVLTNRNGEPWVMRRRTQLELDDLVREAGFEKVRTAVDDAGIFTVSLARRV